MHHSVSVTEEDYQPHSLEEHQQNSLYFIMFDDHFQLQGMFWKEEEPQQNQNRHYTPSKICKASMLMRWASY